MHSIRLTLALVPLLLLASCGGGAPVAPAPQATVINGVASKGAITNGTVTVYALESDGSKGVQLGTGSTNGNGGYSISIGGYKGLVMVEAYGAYTDEATGVPLNVPATAPLRAALANASGTVSLSVTPLTDLAVQQAGPLTAQNVTAANALISDLFKVDIVATLPVAVTASAFQATGTTQAQKDYALALAAVSQQMQTSGGDLAATLSSLNSGISATGMNAQTVTTITAAVNDFIANPSNQTGVTTVANSALQSVGSTSMKLALVLTGSSAASVRGVQTKITFPAGVTLRADSTGSILNGVMTQAANTPAGLSTGRFAAAGNGAAASATLAFVTTGTLLAGDFVTLNADLASGVSAPGAVAFALSGSKLVDAYGNVVSGASLSLR
jgi:hypothetical protein